MSLSGLPFDDIRDLVAQFSPQDEQASMLAKSRSGDLGKLFGDDAHQTKLCAWLAGYSGKSPVVARPMLALFSGTHKVAERMNPVSGETTLETVTRLAAGGAPANQVCAAHDIGLKVFDLALQFPVEDISNSEALDEKGAAATIGFGMEAIAGGVDLLGLAGFGKGSEIANAVLIGTLLELDPVEVLEAIIGANAKGSDNNTVLAECVRQHSTSTNDPLELLRRIGGREHSALAGAILAARTNHVPVVLNGWTGLSVALLLQRLNPVSCDHCCFASMPSGDMAYSQGIKTTGLQSVLSEFGIGGDGAMAAIAIGALRAVANIHTGSVIDIENS